MSYLTPNIFQSFAATADVTIASTVTETSIIGSGVGTATLPANYLIAGKVIRIHCEGYYSTTGSPTTTFKVYYGGIGGTQMMTSGAITCANAAANYHWSVDCIMTCRTTGASGSMYAQGSTDVFTTASLLTDVPSTNTAVTTIDTTASKLIDVSQTWGTSSSSNTITCTNSFIEVLN